MSNKPQDYDLFNNPMVDAARKAMSPEQLEDYKKMGEYMYNSVDYKLREVGSKVKPPTEENLVRYAVEGLRAGLDPMDLSQEELRALIDVYGEEWYKKFDYEACEVSKPFAQLVTAKDAQEEIDRQAQAFRGARQRAKNNHRQELRKKLKAKISSSRK